MAEAFGVDAARLKIVVFVYAALLACISGWLYAHLQRFVNPTPFGINQGIEYLFMAVVGGAGSVWGAVLGATLITLLKQVLQDVLPALLGRSGQFRADRVRHPDGPAAAVRARRPVAVDRAPAAAAHAAAGARRPSRCRRASARARAGPLLDVQKARKQFGGLVAVNDLSFEIRAGRDPRADRPQRRGQEHDLQPHLRRAAADVGRRACSAARRSAAAPPYEIARRGIGRTFQHVKLIPQMSVLDNVALGAYLRGATGVVRAALRARPRRGGAHPGGGGARDRARRAWPTTCSTRRAACRSGKQRIVEIARALACRSGAAAARRAGGGPALPREAGARARCCARCKAEGMTDPAGRARHGLRDGAHRPAGGDGLRREAGRGRARGDPEAIPRCSKPTWAECV